MKKIKSSKGLIPTMREINGIIYIDPLSDKEKEKKFGVQIKYIPADKLYENGVIVDNKEFLKLKELLMSVDIKKPMEEKSLVWFGTKFEFKEFIKSISEGKTEEEIKNFKSKWRFEL